MIRVTSTEDLWNVVGYQLKFSSSLAGETCRFTDDAAIFRVPTNFICAVFDVLFSRPQKQV
jgi:hypothetical protein